MKHREPTHAEREAEFLKRQAEVAQAISGKPELEVLLGLNRTDDEPLRASQTLLLYALTDERANRTRHLRGQVDLAALALKYHDTALHQSKRPQDSETASMFDALEEIRLEAVGGRLYPGMKHNLAERHQARAATLATIHTNPNADSSQFQAALRHILPLIVRERITGEAPPAAMRTLVATWKPLIKHMALAHIDQLKAAIDNQAQFQRLVRQILYDLELSTAAPTSESETSDGEDTPQAQGRDDDHPAEDDDTSPLQPLSRKGTGDAMDDDAGETATPTGMEELEPDAETAEAPARSNRPSFADALNSTNYRVFTTSYDETIEADALAPADELNRLFEQLMQKVRAYHTVTSRLATRLQRLLLAQQTRRWDYELEDGLIDNARLSRVVVRPETTSIYKLERDTDFKDTVVTLLIDNSGSMRGRPITIAALSADILARTLERCGVKVEILGFTTRDWKGGFSRKAWLDNGRGADPGRLNDVRHIIYKSADQRLNRARRNLGLMLKDGILKENIDGEAILWAYSRLKFRKEQRKILMVISDGAPVDDSTLSANSGGYLDAHLRQVIRGIERERAIEMLAIGIGHDVTRYYSKAVTLHDVEQLGDTMLAEITRLFTKDDARSIRKSQRRWAA